MPMLLSTILLAVATAVFAGSLGDDVTEELAHGRPESTSSTVPYQPPMGFGERSWGEPLSTFHDFVADPLYVQIAYGRGKTTLVSMECKSKGATGCDLAASLSTMQQTTAGEGFHALAEYYVDLQGVQLGEAGPILFPVLYQFCAQWHGFSDVLPNDIQQRMKFCGMRLLFRSQTLQEIAASAKAEELVTDYDRVLDALIAAYGEPEDYERRGVVVIVAPDGKFVQPRERRFDEWRWCSLHGDRSIAPSCKASIVLAFDEKTGWGVVLFATRPVWEFAYARHNGGAEDDGLYQLLRGIDKKHPVDTACTGSNLCRPGPPTAMPESRRAQFRLRR
jgi:hypothetical protein